VLWMLRLLVKLVFRLKVVILSMAAGVAIAYGLQAREQSRSWGLLPGDADRELPGDDLVAQPDHVETRSLVIEARPSEDIRCQGRARREVGRGRALADAHDDRIDFTLSRLGDLEDIPRPRFVMAHVVAPHPPFVFDGDGSAVEPQQNFTLIDGDVLLHRDLTREQYVAGYREQLRYITTRIQKALGELLASQYEPAPIIVLQSDHGPGSQFNWKVAALSNLKERFAILNAWYIVDADDCPWYPSISPVNAFRSILGRYFGQDLPLLPDSAFYSPRNYPYQFTNITSRLP